MKQYIDACQKILDEGVWVYNERTGVRCKTIMNLDFTYDVDEGRFPLVTTRKAFPKAAIAELLGYLRGFSSAKQFRELGTTTWDANANENKAWLDNPNRKGKDDMGRVYGVQGREWQTPMQSSVIPSLTFIKYTDQLQKVVNNLSVGIDDRGEIITFWNPGEFHLGCLRPCLHTHHFTLLDGVLHLTSYQRSCDMPLGYTFNAVQCYTLLALMAQLTGHKAGKAYHKIVNAHIYENQIEGIQEQVKRKPYSSPSLKINPEIKRLADIEEWVTPADFTLEGYESHPPIKFPFTV